MKKLSYLLLSWACLLPGLCHSQKIAVFPLQQDGYACFRIPALIEKDGMLIAFAEGRKNNCADFGNNDIVMKCSRDQGRNWSALRVIVDFDSLQASNAAPVVDYTDPAFPRGRIFLFYNTGNAPESDVRSGKGRREVWYITSADNGLDWSRPVNITSQVHKPYRPGGKDTTNNWRGYANTPGHALQLTSGIHKGRLFVAANHTEGAPKPAWADCFAHGFYSDDHGKTFQLTPDVPVPGSNEAIAVELKNGGILLNARNQKGTPRCRIAARSHSGGSAWDTVYYDTKLVEPVCQASMLNASFNGKKVLLFANPDSEIRRINLCIRMSFNDGISWPACLLVVPGEAAYCDLAMVSRRVVGLLFEKGSDGGIYFRKVRLKDIAKTRKDS